MDYSGGGNYYSGEASGVVAYVDPGGISESTSSSNGTGDTGHSVSLSHDPQADHGPENGNGTVGDFHGESNGGNQQQQTGKEILVGTPSDTHGLESGGKSEGTIQYNPNYNVVEDSILVHPDRDSDPDYTDQDGNRNGSVDDNIVYVTATKLPSENDGNADVAPDYGKIADEMNGTVPDSLPSEKTGSPLDLNAINAGYVDSLVAQGKRLEGTGDVAGYINNKLSQLYELTDGFAGKEYLTCVQQVEEFITGGWGQSIVEAGGQIHAFDQTPKGVDGGIEHIFLVVTEANGTQTVLDPYKGTTEPFDPTKYPDAKGFRFGGP